MGLLSHHDLEELLGVYALDAVDPDERIQIEDHLAGCPRCRAELSAHREVAGLFAFAGQTAPAGLWDRITASMQETPPELRFDRIRASMVTAETLADDGGTVTRIRPSSRRRSVGMRVWVASVAAAAAVAAFIGVSVDHGNHTTITASPAVIHGTQPTNTVALTRALHENGSRKVVLGQTVGHRSSLDAVVTPSGTGYIYNSTLTPLGADRTYQLWGVVGNKRISYGLLGTDPSGVIRFEAGTGVQGLAVTDEVATGVVVSHQPVVVYGMVSPSL